MTLDSHKTMPTNVRARKRYILLADICIALSILNAALHFTLPGLSNLAWGALTLGA